MFFCFLRSRPRALRLGGSELGCPFPLSLPSSSGHHLRGTTLGSSQIWLFQTWLYAMLRGSALLHSFGALLRSFAFALFCTHLRSFTHVCVFLRTTAFRTTAFGNCGNPLRGSLRISASQRVFKGERGLNPGERNHCRQNHYVRTLNSKT